MDLRDRIRVLAKEKGMSLPDLEKALGFGNGTIVKWDKAVPNVAKLGAVADLLDVSIDFLLGKPNRINTISEDGKTRFESLVNEYPVDSIKLLSKLCKIERINKDMTEKFVASGSSVQVNEYLSFENDYKNIGIENIINILAFYGLNVSYITGFLTGALIEAKDTKKETDSMLERLHITDSLKEDMIALITAKSENPKLSHGHDSLMVQADDDLATFKKKLYDFFTLLERND